MKMKKLMFAAVAIAAGVAVADVTSANVVGYQNRKIAKNGWNLVCATFSRVDGGASSLAEVKPGDNFTWENPDLIQFLDAGGGTRQREDGYSAMYSFFTAEGEGAPADGWYQYDAATEAGEWLAPEDEDDYSYGAGAVVETADPTAALLFSGAVKKGQQTIIAAKTGWNIIGNPLPIDMTLNDVTPNEVFTWENPDLIQFLDAGGGTRQREDGYSAIYSYFTAEGEGAPADGWYQYDAATEAGEWLAPEDEDNMVLAGSSFVVETADNAAGLQFKAAISEED